MVEERNGVYLSFNNSCAFHYVIYKIGKTANPRYKQISFDYIDTTKGPWKNGYPLSIFNNLSDAKKFMEEWKEDRTLKILSVEYKKAVDTPTHYGKPLSGQICVDKLKVLGEA